jgi:hypothetical protein
MTRRRLIVILLFAAVSVAALALTKHSNRPTARAMAARGGDLVDARVNAGSGPDRTFARKLLDRSTLRRRDEFATPDGDRFTIYEGRTKDGAKVCVVSAGPGAAGSACDTPGFTTSPVLWVEGFSAGPGGTPITAWELSGLAAPNVERLELVDSTGNHRPVHLGRGNTFFVALSREDLKRGVTATTLNVYAGDGSLLESVAL